MAGRRRRRAWVVVAAVLVVLVVVVAGLWWGQDRLVYFPDRSPVPSAAQGWPGPDEWPRAEDVVLVTEDGLELGAWYRPPWGTCRVAVLVAQGNGGNRAGRAVLGDALAARGLGVLLFDYRGYGGNPGAPSEAGLARDARAARDFLRSRAEVDSVTYLGESLGAAVVVGLATGEGDGPDAVVLRSPFTSLADAGRAAMGVPVGWLLRDRYPVLDRIGDVSAPLAVVYGDADTIVPPGQSGAVARAARDAGGDIVETVVPGADHNDLELAAGDELVAAVVEVTRRVGAVGCG